MKYYSHDLSSHIFGSLLGCSILALVVGAAPGDGYAQQGESEQAAEQTESGDEQPPSVDELSAEQKKAYQRHIRAGTSAFENDNYEEAFDELKAAYEIHPKPSILFNLGMISEKAGELKRAKKHYKKFTEAPGVELEDRRRASNRIEGINDILESTESSEEAKKKAQQQTTDLTVAIEAMETGLETGEEIDEGTTEQDEPDESTAEKETEDSEATEKRAGKQVDDDTDAGGGTEATDTGEPERPEISYNWPVYASFGLATAALGGGTVSLMLSKDRIDKGKAAGQKGNRDQQEEYEGEASMFATASSGLFIGGVALAGLGTYFVIRQSTQAKPASEEASNSGMSTPEVSVSLGKVFTGATLSVDF